MQHDVLASSGSATPVLDSARPGQVRSLGEIAYRAYWEAMGYPEVVVPWVGRKRSHRKVWDKVAACVILAGIDRHPSWSGAQILDEAQKRTEAKP